MLISSEGSGGPRVAIHSVRGSYFQEHDFVGKSATQVGRSSAKAHDFVTGDGEVYGKWTQALAPAYDLVYQAITEYKSSRFLKSAGTVIWPILVLSDGTLWAADYGEDCVLIKPPRQVQECSLFLNTSISVSMGFTVSYPVSHLLIFTKSGLDTFLQNYVNDTSFRKKILLDFSEVSDIAQSTFGDSAVSTA
jgi:hypothetical protein